MNGNPAGFILFACVGLAVGVGMQLWANARSEEMIRNWAASEGVLLLEMNHCWFFQGPFFWTTSKNQTVYRVTVQDRQGQIHRAWCRCGSWWGGLMADEVTVRWES